MTYYRTNAIRMNEKVLERWRSKVVLCVCFILFLIDVVLFFWGGDATGVGEDMEALGGEWYWGCIM